MVVGMMYFMVMIVNHFVGANDMVKAQEAATKDSILHAQIHYLIESNQMLKENIRSQQLRIDHLQVKIDNANYKINAIKRITGQ